MADKSSMHKSPVPVAAFVCAALVMLLAGGGYRALNNQLNRQDVGASPIPAGTLEKLPIQIGAWTGRDTPLDEAVVRAADVDDHISRVYVNESRAAAVGLFISFGARARDLTPHRPDVCYPGAGWTLTDRRVIEFLDASGNWKATAYTFLPGRVDTRPLVVLSFFMVDDQLCEDVSLLRARAAKGQSGIRYMLQAQITCRVELYSSPDRAIDSCRDFALELMTPLRALVNEVHPPSASAEPSS